MPAPRRGSCRKIPRRGSSGESLVNSAWIPLQVHAKLFILVACYDPGAVCLYHSDGISLSAR